MTRRPVPAARAARATPTGSAALAAVVAMLLLVLAGCSGGDPATTGATGAAESPATSAPPAATSAPAESPSPPAGDGPGNAGDDAGDDETGGAGDDRAGSTSEPAATPAALRWQARTVAGSRFDAADLAGRPTLLWFWAPWCPSCRGQIPQVKALATAHGDRLDVVGVGSLDDPAAIVGFADDVPQATHLLDPDGAVWKRYGVVEQSSFILLDAEGDVAFRTGYGGSDDLERRVDDLVG